MALFDRKNEQDKIRLELLDDIIDHLTNTNQKLYEAPKDNGFINYLKGIKRNPDSVPFFPFVLFVDVVKTMVENKGDYHLGNYMSGIREATDLYLQMFPFGEETPNFTLDSQIFICFFKSGGLAKSGLFNANLMSTFRDKYNYLDFMNSFCQHQKAPECLHDILQYGLAVRAFFADDDTYGANMKYAAQKMLRAGDREQVVQEEVKRVEHMAGIYDIDEADVAKTEQQLVKANALLKSSTGILEEADRKTSQLNRLLKDTTETIQEISKRETGILTMKATTAKEELNAAYNSFLEEQRQEVILQKDVLIAQLYQEAESKLGELRTMARAITTSANSELLRINNESSLAMDKIQNMMTNDKELQKILTKAEKNNELFDKISKLEVLSTQNIDALAKTLEAQMATSGTDKVIVQQSASPVAVAAPTLEAGTVVAAENVSVEAVPVEIVPATIGPINPLLDTSIPFKERYALVMAEKEKRIANGEHFHTMFDDVLTVLMEDANPYMIGPSGCGKTYMVKQIASLLNMDFTDIGYINEEYDILGFQTATGAYSATNFYRCYKYGKIAFCDELDNGNSRATVKLNSFLSNGKDARYSFPNGESVKRHKNFRIIAAGNTAGNGADANYNTREKIEESVQQRFTPIYVGYDNAVEEKILKKYPDWYQFVVVFRMATDAWGNMNDCSAPGIITTRDAARIKRYLDNQSLSMGKIVDYEFVQTKDMEYLAFLSKHMGDNIKNYPKAKNIYDTFNARVQYLRQQGGVR